MSGCWKKWLCCGVLCAGSVLYGAEKKAPAKMVRPPEVVKAGHVKSVPVVRYRKYIAKVSAVDDVSLVARVSGVILEQKFANGAMVEKDKPLFILEDTTYRVALDSAKARLEQSKAELLKAEAEQVRLEAEYTFAKKNLERQVTLKNKKATSETAYDEAVRQEAVAQAAVKALKASIAALKASVSAAEAAVRDAENNLSYTVISSPISGKAGKAAASPGNYVTPSSGTLVNVVSMDKMYINFWISMNDYLALFGGSFENLKKNMLSEIILADGSRFGGKAEVVFIDNRIDKDTDTIRIRLVVDNAEGKFIPDGLVTVRISCKSGNKTAVPVSAILNNGQVSFVYVLDSGNKASVRPVKLGEVQGNIQIVESGLADGECVVFDGTHKVFPNSVVKPVMTAIDAPKPMEKK